MPARSGIEVNEEADKLDKEAAEGQRYRAKPGWRPTFHTSPAGWPRPDPEKQYSGSLSTFGQSADTTPLGGQAFEESSCAEPTSC